MSIDDKSKKKLPIVKMTEEDLASVAERMSKLGVTCDISKVTVEGGATLPGNEPYSSRRAAITLEALTSIDTLAPNSKAKLDVINEALKRIVTEMVKEQLDALLDIT